VKRLSASDLCVCRDPEHEDKWRSTSHVCTYLTAIKQANKLLNVPAFCLEKCIFMTAWKVKFELRTLIFLWPLAGILGDCGESGPQDPPDPACGLSLYTSPSKMALEVSAESVCGGDKGERLASRRFQVTQGT